MVEQNLTEFERRARILRGYLKPDIRYGDVLPRPFFIEFDGPPSGGKTTIIREADKAFRRQGFRVWRPQEGPEVIRHIPRTTPEYNIRTGLYSLQILLDLSWGHQYDLVLLDRGIFDIHSWMEYWREKDKLTDGEKTTIQKFFLLDFFTSKVDCAFFVVCQPDVAVSRETRFELTHQLGDTTNPQTIQTLLDRFRLVYERLFPDHAQIIYMDTSALSEVEMVRKVTDMILDVLEKKTASDVYRSREQS